MIIKTIPARVHGRFLYENRGEERLLCGFHGYGETAERHMEELQKIPGATDWSLVAVQALHPFYTRAGAIVASWMTSLDRELAIADNIAYVRSVLDSLPHPRTLVFLGFSQGAPMASRAAAHIPASGLILLGGDIPPDVKQPGVKLPPILLARGKRDEWYGEEKFKDDLRFVGNRSDAEVYEFEGGHEWTDGFRERASEFLGAIERRTQSAE